MWYMNVPLKKALSVFIKSHGKAHTHTHTHTHTTTQICLFAVVCFLLVCLRACMPVCLLACNVCLLACLFAYWRDCVQSSLNLIKKAHASIPSGSLACTRLFDCLYIRLIVCLHPCSLICLSKLFLSVYTGRTTARGHNYH